MEERIYVNIAQRRSAAARAVFVCSALGSCIAVCLYDAMRHIGGVAHILLPNAPVPLKGANPDKFADRGIAGLVEDMAAIGAEKRKLRAKIAGGACLFDFGQHAANAGGRAGTEFSFAAIGERNAVEVKKELLRLGIPLIAEDVGGRYGRSVSFSAANGELLIKSLKYGKLVI